MCAYACAHVGKGAFAHVPIAHARMRAHELSFAEIETITRERIEQGF